MHQPRFRITVGQLLFAVAVVALNCGVFRLLYQMVENVHGAEPLPTVPFGVGAGLLPLLNVALIGTFLFVVRRFRSFRHDRAANPRSSSAGFTYFSLHLLALGIVCTIYMPDAIYDSLLSLAFIADFADKAWSVVFERYGDAFPWLFLECSIFGVLISGPLLLLSFIGGLLARRCAASLRPRRFRAMTCLVSLGFASVALAIAVTPRPFEDEQNVDLDFQIVDNNLGQPIGAAFLRISDPFDPTSNPPRAITGPDGRAHLTGRFKAIGERSAFWTWGVFSPWGRWLEVSAPHFQTVRVPLPEVMGRFTDLERPRLRTVALPKGQTPENRCHDIAGIYYEASNGFGWSRFAIEPDGRFAWSARGCTSHSEEYGYLKWKQGEIELVPIPHPGEEIHPLMTLKFRAIAWGDRLYLSTTQDRDLQRFCRAGPNLNRPVRPGDTYGGYVRDSDRQKPQTGLPRLPSKVWAKFLLDEMSLSNEDGSLRLALRSLIPRNDR